MNGGLLSAKEAAELLGISLATFHRLKKMGRMKRFEPRQPLGFEGGTRWYSRHLIEQYVKGEPVSKFGRGARS